MSTEKKREQASFLEPSGSTHDGFPSVPTAYAMVPANVRPLIVASAGVPQFANSPEPPSRHRRDSRANRACETRAYEIDSVLAAQ